MPPIERTEKMSVRLSRDEVNLRDALSRHLGVDHAGVMRMALLKLAREEGIIVPETTKAARPRKA
jgi:hypothetical protein